MLKKKIVKGMLSLATAIMIVGSDPVIPMMESVGVVQEVEAASRKLSSTKVSVMTGEKSKITLKGVSSKKKKSVKWKSNSKNLVVSYSKKDTRSATFYARKAGTYKVTATYGKKTYVAVVKASKKGMNVTSRTLNKGQKYTLKLKGVKGKAKWSSSKKSVVTVKTIKNGKSAVITAKRPGSATITATVGEKKIVCVVKVKGTEAVVTPKPNPTTAPKPTDTPKPQPTESPKPQPTEVPKPTEAPKPTETPEPTPTEPAKPVVKATGIKLSDTDITLTSKGATKKLVATVEPANATDKDVKWYSSNERVVTVDGNGVVTAVRKGMASIYCELVSDGNISEYCDVIVDYDDSSDNDKILAESITLNETYMELTNDWETYELYETILPSNSDETDVVWEISDPDIVSIDEGRLIGHRNGTAVITCYVKGHESLKASCTVKVNLSITEISLNATDVTLDKVGDTYSLVASTYPTCANDKTVSWSSSDSSVVSVDDSGNLKALKEGTAVIICRSDENSSVSASCTVTVKATSTTDPSEQDKTDPTYTFKVRGGSLKSKSVFNGGELANILITTDAPMDKLMITMSNNSIQYNALNYNSEYNYYSFSLYARRKTESCKVSIILDGKQVWSKDIVIVSDDQNWATYESWLNGVLEKIKGSNSDFDKLNPIQKVTLLGQYILDNYDYNADPNKSFHNHGCGNCNASAFVLKDYAQRLGLRSDVVTPKMYAGNASTSSHVVAKIYYDGKIYHVDAGLGGKAPRGKISIMYWNANEYNG